MMKDNKENEINRKYRVLKQTLSMHTFLRDKYKRKAAVLDIALLICATTFCATTFVSDNFYSSIGIVHRDYKLLLGVTSIIAFLASILSLRLDWKGLYTNHSNAVNKLSDLVALFRDTQLEDFSWPKDKIQWLNDNYKNALNNTISIPANLFVKLKAKHLRKVEISKLISEYPGCPVFFVRIKLLFNNINSMAK